MKGVVSLISLSVHLSILYRRPMIFLESIMDPATLLEVFFQLEEFPGGIFVVTYTVILFVDNNTLISFFPFCIPLISFNLSYCCSLFKHFRE